MSYAELHYIIKRATPAQICDYKHAIQLYKLINQELPKSDWVDLNFQQIFHNRIDTFNFVKTNKYKVGLNQLCNRFHTINKSIKYDWMSDNFESYKVRYKNIFLLT